ncbi:MAG TPA: MOSC domain-containing protein [Crenotrichaceae bacterium]|nr:MOSC domain-containing protein [Crenotrichaceae bacterium]
MTIMKLSELYIYPVKSLAGIALSESDVEQTGLKYDRRWMVVTPEGHFLTQRSQPQMALVQTRIENGQLLLSRHDMPDLLVPPVTKNAKRISVTVWRDTLDAVHINTEVDAWLSEAIGIECRLVSFADDVVRAVNPDYSRQGDSTAFADGYPFLLISQASLDDLNSRLQTQLPMKRFRPNLVVTGCEPYAEDQWKQIQIGEIKMRIAKPCSRCATTTVDPETGQYTGKEPLRTLSQYRRQDNKVMFGQNLLHDNTGRLHLGDVVTLDL